MNIFEEIKKEPIIKWSTVISAVVMLGVGVLFLLHRDYSVSNPILNEAFGQFGEFVGGTIGAFLTFASVILLYITLKSQKSEFEKQQVESHFFELLKIHRENRETIISKYPTFFEDSIKCLNEIIYPYIKNRKNDTNNLDLQFIVAISYLFYYYGSSGKQSRATITAVLKKFRDKYCQHIKDEIIAEINVPFSKNENVKVFNSAELGCSSNLKNQYSMSVEIVVGNTTDKYLEIKNKEPILGTYFRHLYQTVKE